MLSKSIGLFQTFLNIKNVQFKDLFNYTCLEIPWVLTTMFSFVSLYFFYKILLLFGIFFSPAHCTLSPTVEFPVTLARKGTAMQKPKKGKQIWGGGYGTMNK